MLVNDPNVCGDIKFRAFRKESTVFADCGGFIDVLGGTRDIPITNRDLPYTQLRVPGFTDEEIYK